MTKPRWYLKHSDLNGHIDAAMYDHLIAHIDGRVQDEAHADFVIVPVGNRADYCFNTALYKTRAPIILIESLEYDWNASNEMSSTHLFGKNTKSNRWLCNNPEWIKLDEWCNMHTNDGSIRAYFKRELFAKDSSDTVLPLEYPCHFQIPETGSKDHFYGRPFEVFNNWGHSHDNRPKLHGRIVQGMATDGLDVIQSFDQITGMPTTAQKRWFSCFSPHWARQPMDRVLQVQQMARVSVSLPGAGMKCFRSSESPIGAIMALHHDEMKWAYPWTHSENCIRLLPGHEFDDLQAALAGLDLYEIYRNSQETIRRYSSKTYANEYVLKKITERL